MKESVKAYSRQKAIVKKALTQAGFEKIEINNGYYYFSGFATKNDKIIYFSLRDTRDTNTHNKALLIRTATDYTDFTGGSNYFSEVSNDCIKRLATGLVKRLANG